MIYLIIRQRIEISIHPPRVGWDQSRSSRARTRRYFNPPTPCGVGRRVDNKQRGKQYFNPPTPCGVGRLATCKMVRPRRFQSTHPVWGGTSVVGFPAEIFQFQSTHPVWGGTAGKRSQRRREQISIHPPRVGWDNSVLNALSASRNFNPPTPCGVGPDVNRLTSRRRGFQSTHPVWGGTRNCYFRERPAGYFNPPTPCGVGLEIVHKVTDTIKFQSTHPVWGGTAILTSWR